MSTQDVVEYQIVDQEIAEMAEIDDLLRYHPDDVTERVNNFCIANIERFIHNPDILEYLLNQMAIERTFCHTSLFDPASTVEISIQMRGSNRVIWRMFKSDAPDQFDSDNLISFFENNKLGRYKRELSLKTFIARVQLFLAEAIDYNPRIQFQSLRQFPPVGLEIES